MLKLSKIAGLIAIAVTTTACGSSYNTSQNSVSETPRAIYSSAAKTPSVLGFFPEPEETAAQKSQRKMALVQSDFDVTDVQVVVPDYLVVSEADVYLPKADIVWREDPIGDRRAQVKEIVENALRQGTTPLQGNRKVIIAARVNMFHALTEKARNSLGGKHNVQFDFVLLDAETRQPITAVQNIDASFKAYGGRKAYQAERRGETQKVRITQHVADEVLRALSKPKQL